MAEHRHEAGAWSKRQALYRKDWERQVLLDKNIELLQEMKKLRGPRGRVIIERGTGCCRTHIHSLPAQMAVPVRQERLKRFARTPWTVEESKSLIHIILKEIDDGKITSGFYKYIEHTYVGHETASLLHPSRNSSNIRGHWGDLCRTIQDQIFRDAAVALYELDEETLHKILTVPDKYVPSKGHDDRRVAAVIRKHRELNPDYDPCRGKRRCADNC